MTVDEAVTVREQERSTGGRKGWLAGPAGALFIFGAMFMGGAGFSVTDDLPVPEMLEELEAARTTFLLGGAAEAMAAFALVVFAAFLGSRLRAVEPAGALTSRVASGGCLLAASLAAMAAAHTQLATMASEQTADPAINLTLHALEENLFAASWCALALPAAAVAVAALRHRVLPTWLGVVSAFVAVLLGVLQVVVPWAGWFPALVWLVAAGTGLRRYRAGAA
jgi:hypothetical protein